MPKSPSSSITGLVPSSPITTRSTTCAPAPEPAASYPFPLPAHGAPRDLMVEGVGPLRCRGGTPRVSRCADRLRPPR
jgi:hypothetical protein